MNRILLSLLMAIISVNGFSQNNWNGSQLVIQNDKIIRIVVLDNGSFTTQSYRLKDYPYNFVSTEKEEPLAFNQKGVGNIQEYRRYRGPDPEEFSFLLNGNKITGKTGWEVVDVKENRKNETTIHQVVLKGTSELNRGLEITVSYMIYARRLSRAD